MRTTFDIADDVLFAARELARSERTTLGDVLSRLARRGLQTPDAAHAGKAARQAPGRLSRLGIHPLPHRGGIVSDEMVKRIRDEEGI